MIKLLEITENNNHPFGNEQGRSALKKLRDFVEANPAEDVFEISLKGIKATDASFPRESVVALAKQLRSEKWFFITHFDSEDLVDNWDYAAKVKEQAFVILKNGKRSVIGPRPKAAGMELLNYVWDCGSVTTAEVSVALKISVQNASTRLKKLVGEGLILRTEEAAATGGIEFTYTAITSSD